MLIDLVKRGANVNVTASGRMTTLMVAVIHRRADLVRLLLNPGVDRTIVNYRGETALSIAKREGYTEIASILAQP